jgi:hypothetical protein
MPRNRSRCGQLRRAADADVEIGRNRWHHARGSSFKLDRVFGRDKALPETKIALQTSGDFISEEYLRETRAIAFSQMMKRRQMQLR